jgi:hypothetical protein
VLAGAPVEQTIRRENTLRVNAQRPLPFNTQLNLNGGRFDWKDNETGVTTDTGYNFARASVGSRPVRWIDAGFHANYISDERAAQIQQALGFQSSGASNEPGSNLLFVSNSASDRDIGGGAQLLLPRGFSAWAGMDTGRAKVSQGNEFDDSSWNAGVSYHHRIQRAGAFSASYSYSQGETHTSALINGQTVPALATDNQNFTVGAFRNLPHRVKVGANAHVGFHDVTSNFISSGRNYGISGDISTSLGRRWKLSGDVRLDHVVSEFTLRSESTVKSFSIHAESHTWQLWMQHQQQDGLALQLGNSVSFITNPEPIQLTPLFPALLSTNSLNTQAQATFSPGKKRLLVMGSWTHLSYNTDALHLTDTTVIYGVVSYNLRRLRLQAGYISTDSQAFALNRKTAYRPREYYFAVIRRFQLF